MKIRLEHQLNKEKNRLTSAHYDAYPFDFLTPEDEKNIASLQPLPFTRFVNAYLGPDSNVVEIGCGPGRASLYLVSLGISLTAVDISPGSILLAKRRAPQARYLLANNMELPFSDKEFDAVISDGVVHHTADPYQSFCELARILRSDGVMYLGVYRRQRYYFYVYTYLGMPIRWLEKTRVGRGLLNLTLIPLYYLVH